MEKFKTLQNFLNLTQNQIFDETRVKVLKAV